MPCLQNRFSSLGSHLCFSTANTARGVSPCTRSLQTRCSSSISSDYAPARRAALLSLAAATVLSAQQAKAFAGWDGESAALGSCAIGEPGDECRRQTLLKDAAKRETYQGSQKPASAANVGVPISEMSDAYTKESAILSEAIIKYGTLDPYDPQRVQVVNLLKTDARNWTSKYARGGNVRKPSARKMYIVVDALQGHITTNGFAPFPKTKMAKLLVDVAEAKALLAKGQ